MADFSQTNEFVNWMKNTPASVSAPVDHTIPDEVVGSTKPLTSFIEQGATGFSGADYVPSVKREPRQPEKPKARFEGVTLDPSGEDYVPGGESKRRQSIRERLVERYTEEILKEYSDQNLRYERAVEFLNKYSDAEFDGLDKKLRDKLERANTIVERGQPMTREMAREMARKRSSTEVIRAER